MNVKLSYSIVVRSFVVLLFITSVTSGLLVIVDVVVAVVKYKPLSEQIYILFD